MTPRPPFVMPAEWEPHRATWISWPHLEPDWPAKLDAIGWVYAEIVRLLSAYERVEILCHDERVRVAAVEALATHGVSTERVSMHLVPTDRSWLRDSAPTAVHDTTGAVRLLDWHFNGWAKYDNWRQDALIGQAMAGLTGLSRIEPRRPDTGDRLVLEGGGIEVNGAGLMLVTEEWLLSDVQIRNAGLSREEYEQAFAEWLGIRHTIWLGEGCVGDDTHGHIDDVGRFVTEDTVVIAVEADPTDENHHRSIDNLRRLELASADPEVGPLRIVPLPFPSPVMWFDERLPASYANFYVANGVVIVPTFNDPKDRVALETLAGLFPDRTVIGLHAVDLVLGLGTLHCLTQQEPLPRTEDRHRGRPLRGDGSIGP